MQLDVHRNAELIYQSSENYPGVGQALLDEIPEVLDFGRLYNMGSKNSIVITNYQATQPIKLKQPQFMYADANIPRLMARPLVSGNTETALSEPFTMIISETMAKNYFGNADPIGKFLRLEDDDFNDELCKVTGVFEDPPPNTHLKFHVLISTATLYGRDNGAGWSEARYKTGWRRKDFYTYIKVLPGIDPELLEEKFPEIVKKHKPELEAQGGEEFSNCSDSQRFI